MIRTVTGDIPPPQGAILIHEHLQIDLTKTKSPATVLGPGDQTDIIEDLKHTVAQHGLRLITDLSGPGSGRNPQALKAISQAAGIHVVAATGFYWEPTHPDVISGSIAQLRDAMIREIETGVAGTNIHCGVIKVGTNYGTPTAAEEKVFRAAAEAARATGAAIITHTSTPDQAQWQIDTLEAAGAELPRVLISHLHGLKDFNELVRHARRGIMFGFDQIGFAKGPSYEAYADLVMRALEANLTDQMMLSSDMARRERLHKKDGTSYGTVFSHLLPLLRQKGVSQEQIEKIMKENPSRLLQLKR
jgi:phosphotriesterase-related protein